MERTYFLDSNGLNIVEPVEPTDDEPCHQGVVVNLAHWADEKAESLEPHRPVPTDLVIDLETDVRH